MGIIKQLTDRLKNNVYPVTKAKAVYMSDGIDTVERVLKDMQDQDATIKFNNETVTKEMASGRKVVTSFKSDGSIEEVTYSDDGKVIQTVVTTFNEDGSISIDVPEGE